MGIASPPTPLRAERGVVTSQRTQSVVKYPAQIAIWVAKIKRNQERDRENYRILQENGWQVIVIWECQLTPTHIDHTMREVELLLNENMLSLYKKHTPIPYGTEDGQLPMAAESDSDF